MNFIKITSDNQFISELDNCRYFLHNNNLSQGLIEIKNRIDEIFDIVHNNKIMIYYQKGYSYLRPFEDSYQDAIDFLKTDYGEKVKQVFYYFAYEYVVSENQLGGYNIDSNFSEDSKV